MPKFELIHMTEAKLKTAAGQTAKHLKEYLGFIERVGKDQAGRLRAESGESARAVRRRLGTAARLAGKELHIKRVEDEVYFWVKGRRRRRKPGSREKNQ